MKVNHALIAMSFIALATTTSAQWSPTIYQTEAAVNVEITRGLANSYISDHLSDFLPLTMNGTLVGNIPYSFTLNMPQVDFQGGNVEFDWAIDYSIQGIPSEFELIFNLPFTTSVTHDQLIAYIEEATSDLSAQIVALIPSITGREELAQVIYNNIIYMIYPIYDTKIYDLAENSVPGQFNIEPIEYSFGVATSAQGGIATISPFIEFEGYEPAIRLSSSGGIVRLSSSNEAVILQFDIYNSNGQFVGSGTGATTLHENFSNNAWYNIGNHAAANYYYDIAVRVGLRIIIMHRNFYRDNSFVVYETPNQH